MIFGTYAMVNLFASTIGQLIIAVGSAESFHLFTIASIFYVIALLPTALTKSPAPAPLAQVQLDVKGLWRNSPIAVVAVLLTGVSNGSFGTLSAVYAKISASTFPVSPCSSALRSLLARPPRSQWAICPIIWIGVS